MKIRILTLIAVISVALFSCSEEDTLVNNVNNQVKITEDTQVLIQDFVNQVNGVTTRTGAESQLGFNTPKSRAALRMYLTGATDCCDRSGSCLPEVIVYPNKPTINMGWFEWISTYQGQQLQQLVDNNQVVVKQDFNSSTNTAYYIYNSVKDNNLEIVVPVAIK